MDMCRCQRLQNCQHLQTFNLQLTPIAIPGFNIPVSILDDFNYWHTDWGYDSISPDGECLANWAAQGNLVLWIDIL